MKLKELRKAAGLTQKELGDLVGASPVSISFYENGQQSPDVDMLKRIADVLHTSIDTILDHNQKHDEDTWNIRERYRNDPNFRILFSAAEKAKPEHLRAAAAMLKSLEGEQDDN